ncbi:hypothetical protein G9A89_014274 [Geosiphon pyriformis]|nr:hypothetical protein G9A89_014274 [Geosiphon pyriformis]
MESEREQKKKEKESEDQEFTYLIPENPEIETPNLQIQQNLNLENPEIGTPNIQTLPNQNNPNPENLLAKKTMPKYDLMTLKKPSQQMNGTTREHSKPSPISYKIPPTYDIKEFKITFLGYFSNNNSINQLANAFTTIKQEKNEAIIQADYFTVLQILNQFIRGLYSSILQCISPIHLQILQNAVTNVRDFELAELEANHVQAINLVINRSSELDSKLKQFSDSINQKLKGYLTDNHAIYQPPQ